MFPNLRHIIDRVSIPMEHKPDVLVWIHTDSGNLFPKEAYSFKNHHSMDLHWAKLVLLGDLCM
ncbi:GDSL esterase/lipase, partial [Trifolium pratense]